jgi:hypothetical protein
MSDAGNDRDPTGVTTTFHYDKEGKLAFVEAPTPPGSSFEHDEARRVFRLTTPDGKTAEFHDRAQRFLVVAPDQQTGKLAPVLSWGVPKVMYLCREKGM